MVQFRFRFWFGLLEMVQVQENRAPNRTKLNFGISIITLLYYYISKKVISIDGVTCHFSIFLLR